MKKVSKFFIYFSLLFLYAVTLHAAEYVAFSLKVAEERIVSTPKDKDFRKTHPEVFTLGGITKIRGLVYDRKNKDVILVGERDPERSILTLDDFVVALRARFIHGKWPLVSIDPTPDTKKTNMQIVRFEGGIENTQFGQDLFDADYRLKQIGMGLLPSGVPGLKTYWDLGMEKAKERSGGSHKIGSRFWFYPVLPSVTVREDVVAIKGLKVGVFTEVLSAEIDGKEIEDLSTFQDQAGDMFAKQISERFENLAAVHPSFSRLQGLDELVALTKAIEEMDEKPDLDWWLMEYQVNQVDTREELKVLKRREEYRVPVSGGYYKGYEEVSGGVELMAVALRLKAGDVTALKEAVSKTKPKHDSLSWRFVVAEWLIPTSPGMLMMDDIAPLITQAVFLQKKKHNNDAIILYGKIIKFKPDWDWPYYNRGSAYYDKGQHNQAISDFTKALEINPKFAKAYNNRGTAYADKGQYDQAIANFNKALEINPMDATAYVNLGSAHGEKDEHNQAISDFTKALEINPKFAEAYYGRGTIYAMTGRYDQATSDLNKSIEINPRYADAHYNRGKTYFLKGQYNQAISDFSKAIEIDPKDVKAYVNKAIICEKVGRIRDALKAYEEFIKHSTQQRGVHIKHAQERIRELQRLDSRAAMANDSNSQLIEAVKAGEVQDVWSLLEKDANCNAKDTAGFTALMYASDKGNAVVVRFLLEKGANVNAQAGPNLTALAFAAIKGHAEVVRELCSKGANANSKDNKGASVLTAAAQEGHIETVRILLDNGADPNSADRDGWTPLMAAASNGQTEIIKILLQRDVNLQAETDDGMMALHAAAQEGCVEAINLLLKNNSDVNAKTHKGNTALIMASDYGHKRAVKALLANGADVNLKNDTGGTALIAAAQKGFLEIVETLLSSGADSSTETTNGWTALKLAEEYGHSEVVKLMERVVNQKINVR